MKKVFSFLLALVLCVSVGANAFAAVPSYLNMESDSVTTPMVKDGEMIEVTLVMSQEATQADADQIWFWKFLEEEHNVKVHVEQVADAVEYKNLALATGDFPDIMLNMGVTTTDLVTYGQNEQMFLKVDQYLDYMPNLKAIYEENPSWKDAITAPDGHMYALGGIADPLDETRAGTSVYLNTKFLEDAGLKMPETLDEFIDALRMFQKVNPDGVAFNGGYKANNPSVILLSSLGFVTTDPTGLTVAMRNGEVVFPYGDKEAYPLFLDAMNTIYSEGLMSRDFYTTTSTTVRGYIAEDKAFTATEDPANANTELFMNWTSNLPLTSSVNDQRVWPSNMNALSTGRWVINANTEYPELCCKIADFFFNKTGLVLGFYGPLTTDEKYMYEGYTKGWYWDDATNWLKYPEVENDPEGRYNGMENLYRQQKIMLFTGVQFGDYRTFFEDVAAYCGTDYRRVWSLDSKDFRCYATRVMYQKPYYTDGYPGNVFFDSKINDRIVELKSVIDPYVEAETAKFITGARALTDEEIAKYFDELDALGYAEYLGYYVDYLK